MCTVGMAERSAISTWGRGGVSEHLQTTGADHRMVSKGVDSKPEGLTVPILLVYGAP